ncbi:DNA processing protein [Parelusimicrobium proximum]|uniref:DNA-processing protein DprA n=1 Tax=Parelusimicrobium proximum TaxID=3228953 RepID=UPI003D1800BE
MISIEERLARIKLNSFIYLRTDWLNRLLDIFGSAEEILKQSPKALASQAKLTIDTAAKLLAEARELDAEKELELVHKVGGRILMQEDDEYPASLRDIKEPPFVLYVRKHLDIKGPRVAMVGTRDITPYGKRCADKFAAELTQCGCVVVSGLARGVDTICHRAAVALRRPTIAVVGTGIGRCYPAENRHLAEAIIDNGGAIISELPFNKPPHAFHFPRRNRIISGLGNCTVVVEGREKSGALITAKMTLEEGKDVFAVPGPIESVQSGGTNRLIKDGAYILLDTEDIIYSIPEDKREGADDSALKKSTATVSAEDLTEDEEKVLAFIGAESKNLDNIVEELGFNVSEAAGILFELEIKGVLSCQDGVYSLNKFRKKA